MKTQLTKFLLPIASLCFLVSCGLQFKSLTLNNLPDSVINSGAGQFDEDFGKLAWSEFTSSVIYKDGTADVWGIEKDDCKEISVSTDVFVEGNKSLKVTWNKSAGSCPWVGFGFGWNGWRGKQLGDIVPYAAIQMKIRTVTGKMNNLPFVFLLEDYSETPVAAAFSASMAEEMPITEEWQTLTVPLSLFAFDDAEVDAYNIKQLIIEMNGIGRVYLDDIEIVPYDNQQIAGKKTNIREPEGQSPYRPFKGFLPTDIFVNNIGDVWGIENDVCKDVKFIADNTHSGSEAIEMKWSRANPGCTWAGVGFGWNGWAPKDLSNIRDKAAIQMYVRAPEGKKLYGLPVVALLEDYDGKVTAGMFNQRYFENFPLTDEWQKVILPLSDFDTESDPIDLTSVKQMMLELIGGGELYIDDIGIIPFTKPEEAIAAEKEVAESPPPLNLPIYLFNDGFPNENGWGIIKDKCRDFTYKTEETTSNKILSLTWEEGVHPCNRIEFGSSWTKWQPVDLGQIQEMAQLSFMMRYQDFPEMYVGFENHDKEKALIKVKPDHIRPLKKNNWYMVSIPLLDIQVANQNYNYTNVRQVIFQVEGSGTVAIDEIRLETENN